MNNIIYRYLLWYWPAIVAIIITLLLIYQYTRPKVTTETLQKGALSQQILLSIEDQLVIEENPEQCAWLESQQRIEKYLSKQRLQTLIVKDKIHYPSYISISLIWTTIWIGVETFLIIRICVVPAYYAHEAIFLGYFAYYIIIGLISYFKR